MALQGDEGSPWHRDIVAAPLGTDKFVSIWIPLSPSSGLEESGALTFASGSHLRDREGDEGAGAGGGGGGGGGKAAGNRFLALERHRERTTEEVCRIFGEIRSHAPLNVGDATAHLGTTLHASKPNQTKEDREAFVVCFFAEGAVLKSDLTLDVLDDLETVIAWRKALPSWEPGIAVNFDEIAPSFSRKLS